MAIGRTFAAMRDYQIDGNKEMIALGTMNVIGSMTSCYIATGLEGRMVIRWNDLIYLYLSHRPFVLVLCRIVLSIGS